MNSEYFLDALAFDRVNANVKANDAVGNIVLAFIDSYTSVDKEIEMSVSDTYYKHIYSLTVLRLV